MKPNYICIGVQKGGTTSLINYLNIHPDIHMQSGEKHFFDRKLSEGKLTKEDIEKYEKQFKTNKLIVGEKTPSYCYLRYAIDRIYDYDKNIKLIILLREPISRAYSHINMYRQLGKKVRISKIHKDEDLIDFFIKQENEKLIDQTKGVRCSQLIRGYYDEILEYILSKFPKKNVYIGISEEINENKFKYYNEIYEFLGAHKLKKIKNLNCHVRKYKKPIPKNLEKYLYDIYKPHNEKLYKILGRKIEIWESYYSKFQ